MSRLHFTLITFAAGCLASGLATQVSAQSYGCYLPRPAISPVAKSARLMRMEDKLAQYQLRVEAAQAMAAAYRANGMIAVAPHIGRLEASAALRQAEAGYAEVAASTTSRKLVAARELASVNKERRKYDAELAQELSEERRSAAAVRLRQAQQGAWPTALRDAAFDGLRTELAAAVAAGSDGAGRYRVSSPQVNVEYARSITMQMRDRLRERVQQTRTTDYLAAMRFLEELKFLGDDTSPFGRGI